MGHHTRVTLTIKIQQLSELILRLKETKPLADFGM